MPDTSLGFTYPDSGGSVNIWEHFEALADDIDAYLVSLAADVRTPVSVTGATVGSAAANFSTNSATARTLNGGKLVYLTLDVNTNNALTATSGNLTDVTCFTLNASYRPSELTGTIFSANAGTGQVQINADGTCVLRTSDVSISAGGDIRFSHCFIRS